MRGGFYNIASGITPGEQRAIQDRKRFAKALPQRRAPRALAAYLYAACAALPTAVET